MARVGAPKVEIQTTMGSFIVELYVDHAPKTCRNFKELAAKGYYDKTQVCLNLPLEKLCNKSLVRTR